MAVRRLLSLHLSLALFSMSPWAHASPPGTSEDPLVEIAHYRDQARWIDALAAIERAQLAKPNDDLLYKLQVLTLSDIGNAYRAWTLYLARPSLFDDAQKQRFEADYVAKMVNWSMAYGPTEATQLDEAKEALARINQYLDRDGTPVERAPLRIRRDRLILLNRLERHEQVRAEAQALQRDAPPLPDYVLPAVADSLLATEHPEEAIPLLEKTVKTDPSLSQSRTQLAYAYLETEQPQRALDLLEAWQKQEPVWHWNGKTPYANWSRYQADITLAMIRAYTGDLPTAQHDVESMVEIAPGSVELQDSLGGIYQMRGWPRRALERYQMAHTLEPRDISPRIGIHETQVALQRDDLARPYYEDLSKRYPNNLSVKRLQREWRAHRGWQIYAYADGGRSSGNANSSSPVGNNDRHYGVEIQTPVIDDRWRLFAFNDRRAAQFRDDKISPSWVGGGIRYRFDHVDAELAALHVNDGVGTTGLRGKFGWQFNDRWHASVSAARNDAEASTQARQAGVSANSVSVAVDYQRDERTQWGIGASQLRYDDGNRRQTLNTNVVQRLMTTPTILIDGLGSAYTSRGTRDDVAYFNPSRDASVELGLRFDQLLWRHYEHQLRHRLTVSLGNYWQQGYGNALVPSAEYRHEWQFGPGRILEYGVNWSRPVYDGKRENRIGFDVAVRWGQ